MFYTFPFLTKSYMSKYFKNLPLIVVAIFLLTSHSFAQTYEPNEKYATSLLNDDFDLLLKTLNQIHPSINRLISESELEQIANEFKNSITEELTELEFQNLVRRYIKNIRCGHTAAKPSIEWYNFYRQNRIQLPFSIVIFENEIYVKESKLKDSKQFDKALIQSINGIKSEQIIKDLRSIQQLDGYSKGYVDKSIERLFSVYFNFLYGVKNEYIIEFKNKAKKSETLIINDSLELREDSNDEKMDNPVLEMSGSKFYILKDQQSTALLDIDGFKRSNYKKYYKQIFDEIETNNIKNLIIDLRGNGGGYFPNTNRLLQYLLDQKFEMSFSKTKTKISNESYLSLGVPDKLTNSLFNLMPDHDKEDPMRNHEIKYKPIKKNHFSGKIFLLTDGGTFSMASYLTAKMKYLYDDCTIIGAETGGGEIGSNALIWYKLTLPNTKVQVMIPYYFIDHKVEENTPGHGVLPDYPIEYGLNDLLINQVDKELILTKALIDQKN